MTSQNESNARSVPVQVVSPTLSVLDDISCQTDHKRLIQSPSDTKSVNIEPYLYNFPPKISDKDQKSQLFHSPLSPLPNRQTRSNLETDLQAKKSQFKAYSLEQLVIAGLYAMQANNGTWQFSPKTEDISQKAIKGIEFVSKAKLMQSTKGDMCNPRQDILQLQQNFETIIQFPVRTSTGIRGSKGLSRKSELKIRLLAILKQDLAQFRSKFSKAFSASFVKNIKEKAEISGHNAETDGNMLDDANFAVLESEKFFEQLITINFQQKYIDLMLGELESMLLDSFSEQGNLVRTAREHYAHLFLQLLQLLHSSKQLFAKNTQQLQDFTIQLQQLNQTHAETERQNQIIHKDAMQQLLDNFEKEKSELSQRLTESNAQNSKMSESMKTLSALFRQIRLDTDALKSVDLKDALEQLQQKYSDNELELHDLRDLRAQHQVILAENAKLMQEKSSLLSKIELKDQILQAKEDLIQKLLHEQAQDLQKTERDAWTQTDSLMPAVILAPVTHPSVKDTSDTASAPMRRNSCLQYRILLPNFGSFRPQQGPSWTLSCMRSILISKLLDETAAALSPNSLSSFSTHLRMPEYVYAYFCPPLVSLPSDAEQLLQTMKESDHLRWCFYYGLRELKRQDLIEAKLFYNLLDQNYQEDEQTFFFYCLHVICTTDPSKRNTCHFYKDFDENAPLHLWISLFHAFIASSIVLIRFSAEDRENVLAQVLNLAVESIPEEEEPIVYLRPTDCANCDWSWLGTGVDLDSRCYIDANAWIELMIREYRKEQAQRRVSIRVLFQMAYNANEDKNMDMGQFQALIRSLNVETPVYAIAALYIRSYSLGPDQVSFEAFMQASEELQFFSTCLRLPSPIAVFNDLLHKSQETCPTIQQLYASTRTASTFFPLRTQHVVSLSISHLTSAMELSDSSGASRDNLQLIMNFFRVISSQFIAEMANAMVYKMRFQDNWKVNKALCALFNCIREKTKGQRMMEIVRQKLCILRVQRHVRGLLWRKSKVPLRLRTLFREKEKRQRTVWNKRFLSLFISDFLLRCVSFVETFAGQSSSADEIYCAFSEPNKPFQRSRHAPFLLFLYEYCLCRFQRREVMEIVLLDLFKSCQMALESQDEATSKEYRKFLIFAWLFGDSSELGPVSSLHETAVFFLRLLGSEHEVLEAFLCGNNGGNIALTVAERILKRLFPAYSEKEHIRLQSVLHRAKSEKQTMYMEMMEIQEFLIFALREWELYWKKRLKDITKAVCKDAVLSVNSIAVYLHQANVSCSIVEAAIVYRRLMEMRTFHLHASLGERVAAASAFLIIRESSVSSDSVHHLSLSPTDSFDLLKFSWEAYKDCIPQPYIYSMQAPSTLNTFTMERQWKIFHDLFASPTTTTSPFPITEDVTSPSICLEDRNSTS